MLATMTIIELFFNQKKLSSREKHKIPFAKLTLFVTRKLKKLFFHLKEKKSRRMSFKNIFYSWTKADVINSTRYEINCYKLFEA
jgi:hypothetical protein